MLLLGAPMLEGFNPRAHKKVEEVRVVVLEIDILLEVLLDVVGFGLWLGLCLLRRRHLMRWLDL